MNKSNKNQLWIYLSLILAMVADNFVFPESILQWKPLLTLLVLIYWNMALPDKVGILEALFFGLMMGFLGSNWIGFFLQKWIIAKILIVLVLIFYQIFCLKILKDLGSNSHNWTGFKLRVFNEIPVLLLLGGIVAAVFKF